MEKIKIFLCTFLAFILVSTAFPGVIGANNTNNINKSNLENIYQKIREEDFNLNIFNDDFEVLSKWFPGQFIVYFLIFVFSIIKILLPDEEA